MRWARRFTPISSTCPSRSTVTGSVTFPPRVLEAGRSTRRYAQPGGPPLLVVATGAYAGEGFHCPALDTLFLAAMLAKRTPGYAGLGFSDPRRLALTPSASMDS